LTGWALAWKEVWKQNPKTSAASGPASFFI
jgi:hypothetical protein